MKHITLVGLSITLLFASACASAAWPTDSPPVSLTDSRYFSNNTTTSSETVLSSSNILANRTITVDRPSIAAVRCEGACTLANVAIRSAEGLRLTSGVVHFDSSYIEGCCTLSGDHGDGIQVYSPGSTGTFLLRNSTVRWTTSNATAGFFIADNWQGTVVIENSVFISGPFGIHFYADVGTLNVYFKNVCFVGPFTWTGVALDNVSGQIQVRQWDNVRNCTLNGTTLTLGSEITCSAAASAGACSGLATGGTTLNPVTNIGVQ